MTPRAVRRFRLAVALAAAAIPVLTAPPAAAHDAPLSTAPAVDATVAAAPDTVRLTLSNPPAESGNVHLSVITVTDGMGRVASDGKERVTGSTISTTLVDGGSGPYVVLWRAVSADGHPIGGSYSFSVPDPAGAPLPSMASPAPTAQPPAAGTPASSAPGQVMPPNNRNAGVTLGIAAAILAAAIGIFMISRRRSDGDAPSK